MPRLIKGCEAGEGSDPRGIGGDYQAEPEATIIRKLGNLSRSTGKKESPKRNTGLARKKPKWQKPYYKMSIDEAEVKLGVTLTPIGVPINKMIRERSVLLQKDTVLEIKNKVYEGLVNYLNVAGYPTEACKDFNTLNINDIVAFTIYPILALFKRKTSRRLHLSREKEISTMGPYTIAMEDFVVCECISVGKKNYVAMVDVKKVSLGEARKQCFLAMKDMRDSNGGGIVYGFITNGDSWRMISFNGEFEISEKIELIFDSMAQDKNRWMKDYSILIDCLNVALSEGARDLMS